MRPFSPKIGLQQLDAMIKLFQIGMRFNLPINSINRITFPFFFSIHCLFNVSCFHPSHLWKCFWCEVISFQSFTFMMFSLWIGFHIEIYHQVVIFYKWFNFFKMEFSMFHELLFLLLLKMWNVSKNLMVQQ